MRKTDFEYWKRMMYRRTLKNDDLKMVDIKGDIFCNEGKRRHICLIIDPSWDKNSWVEKTFEGRAVYKVTESKYPFDSYEGEKVIIFDVMVPELRLLNNCSNVYKTPTPVYGDTRYYVKYWEMNDQRWMFLLLNELPPYYNDEVFKSRFNIIDLRTSSF